MGVVCIRRLRAGVGGREGEGRVVIKGGEREGGRGGGGRERGEGGDQP